MMQVETEILSPRGGFMSDWRKRKYITIALFLIPGCLFYGFLVLNPIVQSFILATFRWVTLRKRVFVGFDNVVTVFRDRFFWKSMFNTLKFMAGTTVLQVSIGFTLGYFLYLQMWGYRFFKTVFFIPVVLATVAVGFVWGYIYSPAFGLLKPAMEFLGLGRLYKPPLAEPGWALFAVILAHTWHFMGIQIMMFTAGFMNMPQDVLEMAQIDGASGWRMLYYMILPLAWEITKTIIILQIIGSLRAFDLIFVMTMGGPNHATEVLTLNMFVRAFENFRIGLGAVVAVVIFLLAMSLTLILRKIMGREVLQY
jgi:raffinose/stachyose/melibiose transport system permease protein